MENFIFCAVKGARKKQIAIKILFLKKDVS